MLTPLSFLIELLHSLPFTNSILIALFIFFFTDWRKDHPTRALLLFFIVHALLFLIWLSNELIIVEPPLPVLDFFMMFYVILITPILYNYMYAVTSGHCMRWKKWVAFYLPLVLLFFVHQVVQMHYGNAPLVSSFSEVMPYWSHPDMIVRLITFLVRIIYGAIMVVGSYLNYKRYQSDLDKDFSYISSRSTFRWMYLVILLYIIYFSLSIVSYVDGDIWVNLWAYLFSAIMNVTLAFFGYAHKSVYSPDFEPLSELEMERENELIDVVQYEKMAMRLNILCQKDQIWRNSQLAASDVIAHLNTNRTYFSKFLQDVYKTNFRTCINTYRVNEAQQMINKNSTMNMMDIYVQCGFSSSSSFNEWFKKITGKTPSEYKEQLQDTKN